MPDRPMREVPVTQSFWVDGIPTLPNRTRGQHWSKTYKEKEEWMNRVGWLARAAKISSYDKARVTFKIQVGSNRKVDPDNLMWAVAKPTLDALQRVGILKDDSIDSIEVAFSFSRSTPKGFWVCLESL